MDGDINKILEEFEKKFIQYSDSEAMNLNGEPYLMGKVEDAKQFLKQALEQPYSVSEWKRIGKERGYDKYFEKKVKEDIIKELKTKNVLDLFNLLEEILGEDFDPDKRIGIELIIFKGTSQAYKQGYKQGRDEEREHWINQPANEHDEKIRKQEREKILGEVRDIDFYGWAEETQRMIKDKLKELNK